MLCYTYTVYVTYIHPLLHTPAQVAVSCSISTYVITSQSFGLATEVHTLQSEREWQTPPSRSTCSLKKTYLVSVFLHVCGILHTHLHAYMLFLYVYLYTYVFAVLHTATRSSTIEKNPHWCAPLQVAASEVATTAARSTCSFEKMHSRLCIFTCLWNREYTFTCVYVSMYIYVIMFLHRWINW